MFDLSKFNRADWLDDSKYILKKKKKKRKKEKKKLLHATKLIITSHVLFTYRDINRLI